MLIIPKHITSYISNLQESLLNSNSRKRKRYLDALNEIVGNLHSISDFCVTYSDSFLYALNLVHELQDLEETMRINGIRIKNKTYSIETSNELIELLTMYSFDDEFSEDAQKIMDFICHSIAFYSERIKYINYKLVASEYAWNNIRSIPGHTSQISTDQLVTKVHFVIDETSNIGNLITLDLAKQAILLESDFDTYENLRNAFDFWFRVGTKGTYYIYIS